MIEIYTWSHMRVDVGDGTECDDFKLLLERSKEISSGVREFGYIFKTYFELIKFCIFSFEFMNP